MNMDKMMKECFAPHTLMHSAFGLGLGIILVNLVPALNNLLIGVVVVVVALGVDMMRKS